MNKLQRQVPQTLTSPTNAAYSMASWRGPYDQLMADEKIWAGSLMVQCDLLEQSFSSMTLLVGTQTSIAAMENSVEIP